MSLDRRPVRVAASFFDDLDAQLPRVRGPSGEPSTSDFQAHELLRIVDRIATGWDELPELIPGRSDYRILASAGLLVPLFSVVAQVAPDGAVELIELDLHLDFEWE